MSISAATNGQRLNDGKIPDDRKGEKPSQTSLQTNALATNAIRNTVSIDSQRNMKFNFDGCVTIGSEGMSFERNGPIVINHNNKRFTSTNFALLDNDGNLVSKPKIQQVFFETIPYISSSKYKFPTLFSKILIIRHFIQNHLESLGKLCGDSIDNNDCFIHALCQAFRILIGTNLQVETTRKLMHDEIGKHKWLETWFKENSEVTFASYKAKLSDHTAFPGYPKREGRLLCEIHKVNLKVYKAEIFGISETEAKELLKDQSKFYEFLHPSIATGPSRFAFYEQDSIIVSGATKTIELVAYPYKGQDYYLPVFDLSNVSG